jgi:hypothetical protein
LIFTLAITVLKHFFGAEWLSAHVIQNAQDGYLRLDFSSDEAREIKSRRIVQLADMLINLQHIGGFDACISRMQTGGRDQTEATHAELEFGRFLRMHDILFRFVHPTGNPDGGNYDFEITYSDGQIACADAKCKLEASEVRPDSITNALNKARKQLPPDRPGIVFVKVPQSWIRTPEMQRSLHQVATEFLRHTKRIVSVKFYANVMVLDDHQVHHLLERMELENLDSKFVPSRDWNLFDSHKFPAIWKEMPASWFQIDNFVDDFLDVEREA